MTPTEPTPYPLPPLSTTCAGTCIDDLLLRFERASDLASLSGVPVLLNSCDAFTIIEYIKMIKNERDTLRETVEKIAVGNGNWVSTDIVIARDTLRKLYPKAASADVVYPTRQE